MVFLRRAGLAFAFLALALVLAAGTLGKGPVEWVRGELGWRAMPEETAPQISNVLDAAYEDAAGDALAQLAAMRAEEGVPGATAAVAIDGTLQQRAGPILMR